MQRDAWPDVRDADDLHDALLTLVALPEGDARLQNSDVVRIGSARSLSTSSIATAPRDARVVDGRTYWVAAERARDVPDALP